MKLVLAFALASATSVLAAEWDIETLSRAPLLRLPWGRSQKGGLAMDELTYELDDPAVLRNGNEFTIGP